MVLRTYFDKNNTIVKNSDVNTGLNPISELFFGGPIGSEQYSRFLFHFDENKLKSLYTGGTFTDLTKLKHTLRMTNTASFDKGLLNGTIASKHRASSFDLIVFKINQPWDNGCGYDYTPSIFLTGDNAYSNGSSNWVSSQTAISWSGGTGVYSGSSSGITIGTQHFDKGNENIQIDITDYVNGVLTGDTNYGLGIAYTSAYEQMSSIPLQYVGFFTNNTQLFYKPLVETIYSNHITDDRNNFYLDKPNKLYLYVNIAGNPTNLDTIPSVKIYDQEDILFSSYTPSDVSHVTMGVYSIDILVPTNANNLETMYSDVWSGITINGVTRSNISLDFIVKDSMNYYGIGNNDMLPKKVAVSIGGIKNNERITSKEIRKVIVSARIPYTVEQSENISNLEYRIYVKEGRSQLTVVDYQPIEMANNYYYFLLDSASLLPNTYYIDIKVTSNLEVTVKNEVVNFDIVSLSELRNSQ